MSNLNEIITFNFESAYDCAYDLSMKKNYSPPKLYTAKGDLKKRWYVYFSFRDPKTGKLKRVTPFYGEAHKYKTKEDRLYVLSAYRKKILELLKKGYNPFEDNTELHIKQKELANTKKIANRKTEPTTKVQPTVTKKKPVAIHEKTIKEALDFALLIKKNIVTASTYNAYKGKAKALQVFITKNYAGITHIHLLTKNIMVQFLNDVLQRTSPRNRNNYRLELSSLFQTLEDNEIIVSNFLKKIPTLKAIPERNKTYTKETQEAIFKFLETKDPTLLLYIKFISYNFLRPIEVCRLKVGDINLIDKTIAFKAKNSPLKTKIIPDILIDELPNLSNLDRDNPLFTIHGLGNSWKATPHNRRDHFSKRFKKVVKEHFNLGADYTLYSFRHTYITKLYRELVKNSSPFEAKSRLMFITGHSSMVALEKYLRDIDAALPDDYSEFLREK